MREVVPPALDGERLDRVVAMMTGRSRSEAVAMLADGSVLIDDATSTKPAVRVHTGEMIDITLAPERVAAPLVADANVSFEVVHADDDLIVVDKPAGLVVHPGSGRSTGTLVQGLLARFPEVAHVGEPGRPGIVHRLDKGTSGLLLVARTGAAYAALVTMLRRHDVVRRYRTLVWGHPDAEAGLVDAPIGRSAREPTRMTVSLDGKAARTRYEVVTRFTDPVRVAEVVCHLETGRTHQIRVHLSSIGHPVVGDARYNGERQSLPMRRPWLHAEHLELAHPTSGLPLAFDAPLPDDLRSIRDRLR
jgi:23S rRNA pseudouridine1911/1915/1917 synthase